MRVLFAVLGVAALGLGTRQRVSGVDRQLAGDSGTIRIHLLGHAIGSERYVIRPDPGALALTDTFEFTDRGGRVQLVSSLRYTTAFDPIHLRSVGRTYRFVNVDADVVIDGARATVRSLGDSITTMVPPAVFTVAGYAPLEMQALMVRYWRGHGRPARLRIVPGDSTAAVTIEDLGAARIAVGVETNMGSYVTVHVDRNITLERFSIDGVAWGREILYLDEASRFVAIVTRANLLPLEGVREDLIADHPALLDSIQADAVRLELAAASTLAKSVNTSKSVNDSKSVNTSKSGNISKSVNASKSGDGSTADGEFALVGGRIIDGTSASPIEDGTLLVRDGRIVAVGPRSSVTIPSGAKTIDVRGKTIIPGLWDMHAHVALPEWGLEYLGVGVTTARDMGGEMRFLTAFRDALRDGQVLGPRLLLAGLVDGSGPEAFGTVTADTPEQGRAVVDAYHAAGFQQMKLYTLIKPDVAGAIIRHAHEVGMTVTGHVPRAMTLASMVDSGTDNVAHLPVRGDPSSDAVKQQIQMLASHHVVIDPTVSWNELLGRSNAESLTSFQPGFAGAPWPLRASYGSVRNAGDTATTHRALRAQLAVIKAMHDAGVRIVAGTDYGLPGFSLLRELELYVEAGFTPLEAIRSATVVPAEVMGMSADVGSIVVGKRADLVVLDADPLTDIHNLRKGRWVVAAGRIYDMTTLRRAVHFAQ